MKVTFLQCLGIVAVALTMWLIGQTAMHVKAFGWFTGVLLLISMAFVALIVITERMKDNKADE